MTGNEFNNKNLGQWEHASGPEITRQMTLASIQSLSATTSALSGSHRAGNLFCVSTSTLKLVKEENGARFLRFQFAFLLPARCRPLMCAVLVRSVSTRMKCAPP